MWVLAVLIAVMAVGSALLAWRDRRRGRTTAQHGPARPGTRRWVDRRDLR